MSQSLSLNEVHQLCMTLLTGYGASDSHARAVADTITAAERDQCHSHGIFRLPGYVNALKSGKVKGDPQPNCEQLTPAIVRVDGQNCFAPYAFNAARDMLIASAKNCGLAALSMVGVHHFSALWVEIEALTEQNLCGMAFTAYMPAVAPAGGIRSFYGTNPMAFGWPRKNQPPMIFDQATASRAKGDVMIAARDGETVPLGTGIDAQGEDTTNPQAILDGGTLLPFGGYKGANLALMIELLVGPLLGEHTSVEAGQHDNKDGGPPQGGELILAIDPSRFGSQRDPFAHAEHLFSALLEMEGTRLPGYARHQRRAQDMTQAVSIPQSLYDNIISLKP